MIRKVVLVCLLATAIFASGYTKPDTYVIDAQKNAVMHNNLGLNDVADENYYAAVQEFFIAISLDPNTQATAVYYNNLGETYMKMGYYKNAQNSFEKAIKQYNLNFVYYQNLVKAIKAQGKVASQIQICKAKGEKNPMNVMMLGLLYVANGDVRGGIIKLDEFCMREPELLITSAVRNYLQEITPKD